MCRCTGCGASEAAGCCCALLLVSLPAHLMCLLTLLLAGTDGLECVPLPACRHLPPLRACDHLQVNQRCCPPVPILRAGRVQVLAGPGCVSLSTHCACLPLACACSCRNRNLRMPDDADMSGQLQAKYEDGVSGLWFLVDVGVLGWVGGWEGRAGAAVHSSGCGCSCCRSLPALPVSDLPPCPALPAYPAGAARPHS